MELEEIDPNTHVLPLQRRHSRFGGTLALDGGEKIIHKKPHSSTHRVAEQIDLMEFGFMLQLKIH